MDRILLAESLRRGLFRVIVLTDPSATEDESLAALRARYDRAVQVRSKEAVAADLGLSQAELEEQFTPRLRRAVPSKNHQAEIEPVAEAIAQLRALTWIEIILKRRFKTEPAVLLEVQQPDVLAKKQVRAVELVLRAFISERYGQQDALVERLRTLFKSSIVDRWLADAEPGNVLTGTLFSELASIFTHRDEWAKYAPAYRDFPIVAYLKDNRETIRTFLEDIRFVRNAIAHYKELSGVQIELLNLYYGQLVEPIQHLFDLGQTKVNPAEIMEVDRGALDNYFSVLKSDIEDLGQRTREIQRDLKTVHAEVGVIDERTQRTHVSVSLIIVLLVLAGGMIAYVTLHVRTSLARDYRSLGWVTLSAGAAGNTIPLQAEVWMGDETARFQDAKLLAVAQKGQATLAEVDLTGKFNPRQVGQQEEVAFQVPVGTDTLITCFSIPSARLGGRYTVIQKFGLSQGSSTVEITPVDKERVAEGDTSTCGVR